MSDLKSSEIMFYRPTGRKQKFRRWEKYPGLQSRKTNFKAKRKLNKFQETSHGMRGYFAKLPELKHLSRIFYCQTYNTLYAAFN